MKSVLNYVLSCRYFQREFVPYSWKLFDSLLLRYVIYRILMDFSFLIDSRFNNSSGRKGLFSKVDHSYVLAYYVLRRFLEL